MIGARFLVTTAKKTIAHKCSLPRNASKGSLNKHLKAFERLKDFLNLRISRGHPRIVYMGLNNQERLINRTFTNIFLQQLTIIG